MDTQGKFCDVCLIGSENVGDFLLETGFEAIMLWKWPISAKMSN